VWDWRGFPLFGREPCVLVIGNMKFNDRNASPALDQARSVIRTLEEQCGIWNLQVRDIPIWWFARLEAYEQLVTYCRSNSEQELSVDGKNKLELVPRFLSICSKGVVFGLRALSGMVQTTYMKARFRKRPVMFLSVPADFRGVRGKEVSDIFLGLIYKEMHEDAIVVERTTLSKWDFHSLVFRRKAVFFDWLLLRAVLKLFPNLREPPRIEGWHALCSKCQGMDFGSISSEHLLNMVHSIIAGLSRKVVVQVEAAAMALQTVKPKGVIEICSYDSAPRAINLVAKRYGIPIMELQHGFISKSHMGYTYFIPDDYQGERPVPDRIMVYGEAFKKAILTTGTAFIPENTVVTGFPRLSAFLNKVESEGRNSLRKRIRQYLGIAQDTFVLTITTQPTTSSCLGTFLEEVLRTLDGDKYALYVKPHPSEAETWKKSYGDIIQDHRVRIVTDRGIDLYELLVASNAHVTVYSTVFLECFALGVPNIIIGCPGYQHVLELVDEEEIVLVNDEEAFVAELTKLARDVVYRQEVVRRGMETAKRFFALGNSPVEMIRREIELHMKSREDDPKGGSK